jgi:hypothetical protein
MKKETPKVKEEAKSVLNRRRSDGKRTDISELAKHDPLGMAMTWDSKKGKYARAKQPKP